MQGPVVRKEGVVTLLRLGHIDRMLCARIFSVYFQALALSTPTSTKLRKRV